MEALVGVALSGAMVDGDRMTGSVSWCSSCWWASPNSLSDSREGTSVLAPDGGTGGATPCTGLVTVASATGETYLAPVGELRPSNVLACFTRCTSGFASL